MRVLITGGAGLIGFNLANYCISKGDQVVIMDNLERSNLLGHLVTDERRTYNAKKLEDVCEVLYRDISDSHSFVDIGNFDAIFHLAAQCGVPPSIKNPRRDFEINTVGTFNVLEHARKTGGRIVYASTNKVYPLHDMWFLDKDISRWRWLNGDYDKNGFPVVESYCGSRTPYGTSKYMGDLLCQEFYHTYGVPTGVFRMSCIFGTNQFSFEEQGWITWFAIANLYNKPITIYGDGNQVRDVLWVGDLVKAYYNYAISDIPHGVWNMGGGPENTYSLKEAIQDIESITNIKTKVSYGNWRPSDQKVYTSNILPVKKSLNWEPSTSPKQGLEQVIQWVESVGDIF